METMFKMNGRQFEIRVLSVKINVPIQLNKYQKKYIKDDGMVLEYVFICRKNNTCAIFTSRNEFI